MGPTPLYDALRAFAGQDALRMHMPGHKGKPLPAPELAGLAALDVTELGPTGDLFAGGGPIGAAEALWAARFRLPNCLFLTGGSTQGVLCALTLACAPGEGVLLDRDSHRSAYNALALLDLRPVWLERPWLEGPGAAGPVTPAAVDAALAAHPEVRAVFLTSPTYYGVCSDLPALAAAAHARGCVLVVDAAHGAHLPFLGDWDLSAADLAVVSAHKTLPAPGQTALLFSSDRFPQQALRRAAALYGSSSPSYVFLAALDVCRAWMEETGERAYRKTAAAVERLRARYPALRPSDAPLDPCRFVLCTPDGLAARARLEEAGIYVELADRGHILCILTCMDTPEDLARLTAALDTLPAGRRRLPPPPPPPEAVLTPRQALFARRETLPLHAAAGRVCAQHLAPYPPGIPIVAPGERIEKKTVAYFERIGYNMVEDIQVVH
mgnify:FL=1